MGLRINTNIASLGAQRQLFATTDRLTQGMARLASGLRIARASDDAAGLAISERMRAEVRSLAAAERNLLDGIGLARTADAAVGELQDHVVRIRELALQSLNGTLGANDRAVLTAEYDLIVEEMDRIVEGTEFNGISLLSQFDTLDIQAGTGSSSSVSVSTLDLGVYADVFGFFDLGSEFGARFAILIADIATDAFGSVRGSFGAAQNKFESALRANQNARENLSAAESRIRDVDVATETAGLARNQILQNAAVSVLAQANVQPSLALSLLGNG